MKSFIKKIYNKIGAVGMMFLGIFVLTIICLCINMGIYYKNPISLNDNDDFNNIKTELVEYHNTTNISNIEIKSMEFPHLADTIVKIAPKCEGNIYWNTVVVKYDVNDSLHYYTIFEKEYKFLKEVVGKNIITFENIYY